MSQDEELTVALNLSVFDLARQPLDLYGRLDTGADTNAISQTSIELLGHTVKKYDGRDYSGAGSSSITPLGQVDIFFRWNGSATGKLHKEVFLVFKDIPFDIVLGKSFLEKFSVYVFNGMLLPLALKPASAEEKQQMRLKEQKERAQQEADEQAEIRQREQERLKERNAVNQSGGRNSGGGA
jgi:hypothetical protein